MPQPIYLPQQQDVWAQYLPMAQNLMKLGFMKMQGDIDLANKEKIENEKYKNFEKEQTFKQQTEIATEQGKRDIKTKDIVDSLQEVPDGTDTSKLTNVTKIGGKNYFLPHGTRYDAGTQSLENLPEAKTPQKAEIATIGGKKYEVFHKDGRLSLGAELGDAEPKAWQPGSKEEYIESRQAGRAPASDKTRYQPANVTFRDGTTGTANFNPKTGKYFDPETQKDITGNINTRGIPKKSTADAFAETFGGGDKNPPVKTGGNQPKVDATSLRSDLIKNGYTEKEADEYIKRAKAARKL